MVRDIKDENYREYWYDHVDAVGKKNLTQNLYI